MIAYICILIVFLQNFVLGQNNSISGSPQYGGEYVFKQKSDLCLDQNRKAELHNKLRKSIIQLSELGKINLQNSSFLQPSSYIWPMKLANNSDDYSYYGISGFVDHNLSFPDSIRDYNGGSRSYDLESGYNHQGTDFFTWPFGWYKMDYDQVEIVAAANGVIIGKDDGNFDRNCGFGNEMWNAVYLRHEDGSIGWYGHMKKNSTISKTIGESVTAGEYLGIVGSSGSSTGPHLHLEIYDSNQNLIDPWFGEFNPTITSSWWINQKPYFDSKVNKISTHSGWPDFRECPQQEIHKLQNEFAPGDTVYLVTYYQDQLAGQISNFKLTNPENQIISQWNHSAEVTHYSASYWGWWFITSPDQALGNYKFSVDYEGRFYDHNFVITENPTSINYFEDTPLSFDLQQNFPNPFNPTTLISYKLAVNSLVQLKIFDVLGRETVTLVNEPQDAGNYHVEFDAIGLPSGVYFYTLRTNKGYFQTRKMVLSK